MQYKKGYSISLRRKQQGIGSLAMLKSYSQKGMHTQTHTQHTYSEVGTLLSNLHNWLI